MRDVISLLVVSPESHRLRRLWPILDAPLDDPRLWMLLSRLADLSANGIWDAAQEYLHGKTTSNSSTGWSRSDLHAALVRSLLYDQRLVPAKTMVVERSLPSFGRYVDYSLTIAGQVHHQTVADTAHHSGPPADFRVSDVATILHCPVNPWAGRTALDAAADHLG